jgi:hypothetical protein
MGFKLSLLIAREKWTVGEISGSQGGEYENDSLVYYAV